MQSQNGFDLVQLEFKIVSGPKDNTITRVNKLYLLCLSSELYTMAANIPLPYSSLHNVIVDSFCVLFILWSLLNGKAFLALFLFLTSQLFKKVPVETESPHFMGGTNTNLHYWAAKHCASILHPVSHFVRITKQTQPRRN